MIFVVDSGSTKTDWIALGSAGEVLFSTQTLGLNPQVLSSAILNERIINNFGDDAAKVLHMEEEYSNSFFTSSHFASPISTRLALYD